MTASFNPDFDRMPFVESKDDSTVTVPVTEPHTKYLAYTDANGGVHLFPVHHLDKADREVFEDDKFYESLVRGLDDVRNGRVRELDWVLSEA